MEELDGWTFSHHAISRALDMAVPAEELRDIIATPADVFQQSAYRDDGYEIRTNRRVALAVNPESRRVITVMWYRKRGEYRFTRSLDEDLKRIRDLT